MECTCIIPFPSLWCMYSWGMSAWDSFFTLYMRAQSLDRVQLFATPWTVALQAHLWNFPGKDTGVSFHALFHYSLHDVKGERKEKAAQALLREESGSVQRSIYPK